jgi:hypothetical protein
MSRNNHIEELERNREARTIRNMESKRKVSVGELIQRRRHTVQRNLVRVECDPRRQGGTICLQNGIASVIHTCECVAIKADTKRPTGRDAERRILRPLERRDNLG